MRGKFYTTSEKAWDAMLAAIIGSRESIYLEMYIFEGDTQGQDFLRELEIKARAGVRVIIILDALGSFVLANTAIEQLRSVGAEVLFFSYWFKRTHRKMLIIDGHTIFLGGVNISKQFTAWRDLQVRLTGRVAVVAIQSFARIYRECGGKNPELLNVKFSPAIVQRARAWFIENGIQERFYKLHTHYQNNIDNAEKSIVLVTPYLIPHPWMVTHIHRAVLRGVKVTIIIPQKTDHAFIDRINYFFAYQFEKIGAHCLLGQQMNHAKMMLVDERIGTMGSQNFDIFSFGWNMESGIFFDDVEMIGELNTIVKKWIAETKNFPDIKFEPKWYDTFIVFLIRLFAKTP